MKDNKNYLRIRPGIDISINTPILHINIGYGHLKSVDTNCGTPSGIYNVDINSIRRTLKKKHGHMFESPSHVDDYVPVGQVQARIHRFEQSTQRVMDPNLSIILANTRVVPVSNEYVRIVNRS